MNQTNDILDLKVGDVVIALVQKTPMKASNGKVEMNLTIVHKDTIASGPDAGKPFWRGLSKDRKLRSFTSKDVLRIIDPANK